MARHHMTSEGPIPFTPEEEAEWDARESAFEAGAADRQLDEVRADRDQRLAACDWTQLPDAPLSNTETADWGSYRQALRDITTQSDPFNIQWPTPPGA